MKTIAFTALHYGRDYLSYAMRSVIDSVSEFHVLYTDRGSHGHRTDQPCPDRKDELYALAEQAAGHRLRWHEGTWNSEGEQRDAIFRLAPNADIIVVVDADEVYDDELADHAARFAWDHNIHRLRLPFTHLWRSFYKGFTKDPAYPERIILPRLPGGVKETYQTNLRVYHYGYAQRSELVRYKMLTHGHRGQFRTDVDWFSDVFMANRQTDCHPVGSEYWNAEDISLGAHPMLMWSHPYSRMDVIP